MELNNAQKTAADHYLGPMLVKAGPGSGKTAVIICRIKNLIEKHHVVPKSILTVTFTKAAACEMENRFRNLRLASSRGPAFGTFHSVFYKMLKNARASDIRIITQSHKTYILRSELERYVPECDDPASLTLEILNCISSCKNLPGQDISLPPGITHDIFEKLFHSYQSALKNNHMLDFDDILLYALRLLRADTKLLSYWQEYFHFILIDEFQDINSLQYELMLMLCEKHRNIFAVGDEDQSIYSFRGASSSMVRRFEKDFPQCRKIVLNVNYRCPCAILRPSLRLIENNPDRQKRKALSAVPDTDSFFDIVSFKDQEEEYSRIASLMLRYRQQGILFSDMAVLLRSSRYIPHIKELFSSQGIPCGMDNSSATLTDIFIITDLSAYYKAALKKASRKDILRIINRPSRYISANAVPESMNVDIFSCMKNYYAPNPKILKRIDDLKNQLDFLRALHPYAGIEYILKGIGYESFLRTYCAENSLPYDNYDKAILKLKNAARSFSGVQDFTDFLSLSSDKACASKPLSLSDGEDCVNILTMHASKGLEFKVVFLPDLNDHIIPSPHSVSEQAVCEERRLMYVAMTRSSQKLHLSWCRYFYKKKSSASQFISEII